MPLKNQLPITTHVSSVERNPKCEIIALEVGSDTECSIGINDIRQAPKFNMACTCSGGHPGCRNDLKLLLHYKLYIVIYKLLFILHAEWER